MSKAHSEAVTWSIIIEGIEILSLSLVPTAIFTTTREFRAISLDFDKKEAEYAYYEE